MRLPEDFVQAYARRRPPWGPLGLVVYLRTYARFDPERGRRERWHETVRRAVEYSLSLDPVTPDAERLEEAQRLFALVHDLKAFPAGRTLWIGGTPLARAHGQANYNCAFLDVRGPEAFAEMTLLLMSGCGVGFRVTRDNLEALNRALPLPERLPALEIRPYAWLGYVHPEYTEATQEHPLPDGVLLRVGDSREGWAEAVRRYLELLPRARRIVVDVNSVRPQGERLRGFGGHASGPEPLMHFFRQAHRVLGRAPRGRWDDVKALDLMNLLGQTVVAGGTRRSAQIALGDADSAAFRDAKTGDWFIQHPWRAQSNNTLVFPERPTRRELLEVLDRVLEYGEPGLLNEAAARRRRPDFRGLNPCGEVLLADRGFCNLATVNLMAFLRPDGTLDRAGLAEAFRLVTRHAVRLTLPPLPDALAAWRAVREQDRLIGVSFTGFGDLTDALGYAPYDLLAEMRRVVHAEADRYADQLGIARPRLKTTVKPEGTLSQLPGVSSGLHPSFAPHYLRRVRIGQADAVAQALRALGLEPKPEAGYADLEAAPTWVYEFPVRSPAPRPAYAYSAVEQLERYRHVARVWADHNPSVTVYLAPEEREAVADWLLAHWDEYVAVSFLPKTAHAYPLMPYEAISEAEYRARAAALPNLDRLPEVVDALEGGTLRATDDLEAGCAGGACPVR